MALVHQPHRFLPDQVGGGDEPVHAGEAADDEERAHALMDHGLLGLVQCDRGVDGRGLDLGQVGHHFQAGRRQRHGANGLGNGLGDARIFGKTEGSER